MPKSQHDFNAELVWSTLKLGKHDALTSGFIPVSKSITQIKDAYYFYNEKYDRLVIIYPPSATRHEADFPIWLWDNSFRRLYALRKALGKPGSKVVELALHDTFLNGFQGDKCGPRVTKLYEVYPDQNVRPETDEDRENIHFNDQQGRKSRTLILDEEPEFFLVSVVQKLQYLCDKRDSSQRMDKILQKDIDALYTHIDNFRVYAEGLEQDTSSDNSLSSLAVSLKRVAENFFQNNTAITSTECAEFKRHFMERLHAQDSIINTTGKQIVANILIALTGIGALLLLMQLTHSAYKTGSCFFFFSEQVKTQSKIDVIDNAVIQLTEPQLSGVSII